MKLYGILFCLILSNSPFLSGNWLLTEEAEIVYVAVNEELKLDKMIEIKIIINIKSKITLEPGNKD